MTAYTAIGPSEDRPRRIGMITPSSNTCLEPMTYRILGERADVTIHAARTRVTAIALDDSSDDQFAVGPMREAAESLATAQVDVIAWNGTSGSWVGLDHDRAICRAITQETGIRATTSTLAYFDAFERFGITRIGLLTPYTPDVNAQIIAAYARAGVEVVGDVALGLSDNESFARVLSPSLVDPSMHLVEQMPDALVYLCTNLYGAPIVREVEDRTEIPVLDSVAVTLWGCLDAVGLPLLERRWGRLLS